MLYIKSNKTYIDYTKLWYLYKEKPPLLCLAAPLVALMGYKDTSSFWGCKPRLYQWPSIALLKISGSDWGMSIIQNCFKGNGDALDRENYKGLKLFEHLVFFCHRQTIYKAWVHNVLLYKRVRNEEWSRDQTWSNPNKLANL